MPTTFNDWWESLTYIPNDKKILSKLAWEADILCPNCGKDIRWHVCPYCPVHDVEKYYEDREEDEI